MAQMTYYDIPLDAGTYRTSPYIVQGLVAWKDLPSDCFDVDDCTHIANPGVLLSDLQSGDNPDVDENELAYLMKTHIYES